MKNFVHFDERKDEITAANITQSHIHNQTLFHLVKQENCQLHRPHRVSALAQVPAPVRPQIPLISISSRFHSAREKSKLGGGR